MSIKKRLKQGLIIFLVFYLVHLTYITAGIQLAAGLSNLTYGKGYISNGFVSEEMFERMNQRYSKAEHPEIAFDVYRRTSPIVFYWGTGAKAVYWESENTYDEYFRNLSGGEMCASLVSIEWKDGKYSITEYSSLEIPLYLYIKEKAENWLWRQKRERIKKQYADSAYRFY